MNCPSRSISGSRQCRAVCATLSRLSRSKVSHGGSRIMTASTHCAAKFAKKPAQTTSHTNLGKSVGRSEEHTSELQSLMSISYAVFCLKKKKSTDKNNSHRR